MNSIYNSDANTTEHYNSIYAKSKYSVPGGIEHLNSLYAKGGDIEHKNSIYDKNDARFEQGKR